MNFNIGPFKDEVLCDIMSMSACHVLLGRPWQYDKGSIYDCRRNPITIEKDEQKFTLASLKEKEKEVKNLIFVKSYSVEKQEAKVIPNDGMDLKKDLANGFVSKMKPNGSEVRVVGEDKKSLGGRNRLYLLKKESGKKRQCAGMKQGEI